METPFAEYKATELPDETLQDYFVEPRYISKMYPNNVSFIIGQRGTGKTTLLKHLCNSYNKNDGIHKERLGIYYRFDINKMHSFSGSALTPEDWNALFAHCFSIEICLNLTNLLLSLKSSYPLKDEAIFCSKIRRLFYDDSPINISNLEGLKDYLEYIDYLAKRYKRNPLRAPAPMISECEKTFELFCELISKEPSFSGVCVHFLFDEYENMLDYQQEFINSCAKNASYYHTFKICVRPYGMTDMKTRKATEILNEADDFRTLDYTSDIIGTDEDVAEFMRKACARRLEKYYKDKHTAYCQDDLVIDKYFSRSKDDDTLFGELSKNEKYVNEVVEEVKLIFSSFGMLYSEEWDLLQLKLFIALSQKRGFNIRSTINSFNNRDSKYKNWLNNYKKSILFLCFQEQQLHYQMSGFEDIIKIAGNVVRYVLEICDYCFLCTSSSDNGTFAVINEKMQTEAIYKVSKRRFQQISTIPDYGQEIKQMVLVIGTIFNMYHRDSQLKRFEPNHFSIERKNKAVEKYNESTIQQAIQLSVMYGVFEAKKSTKNRSDSDVPIEDEDFHLHPILTPYFQISWRSKQKCRFTLDELNDFLFGNDEKVSRILSKYFSDTKNNTIGHNEAQISFSDLKRECF